MAATLNFDKEIVTAAKAFGASKLFENSEAPIAEPELKEEVLKLVGAFVAHVEPKWKWDVEKASAAENSKRIRK